ncbi:hypothetical protein HYW20_02890 [Candidatus Woesearchaeota archaeon]|nr:hypothetical protein [Candidatus Woesearchaeota archaeon]
MKKIEMLNKMQKKGIMETAVLAGITVFIFTLILLTIQSATGHKSWLLSSALSLLALVIIFMFIEKSRLKNHEKFVH